MKDPKTQHNPSSLAIKSWSEEDRPREKLMLKGVQALSDSELLAIIIGSGTPNMSAVALSRLILAECTNDLSQLSKMSMADLLKFKGIGEAKAISVLATMEIGRRRLLANKSEEHFMGSSQAAYDVIGPQLKDLDIEQFWILLHNSKLKFLRKFMISGGGMTMTIVDPRVVFKLALEHNATGIVLVHNHPSGDPTPSSQDKQITSKLKAGGDLLDVRITDHLIIGKDTYFSFMDEGELF